MLHGATTIGEQVSQHLKLNLLSRESRALRVCQPVAQTQCHLHPHVATRSVLQAAHYLGADTSAWANCLWRALGGDAGLCSTSKNNARKTNARFASTRARLPASVAQAFCSQHPAVLATYLSLAQKLQRCPAVCHEAVLRCCTQRTSQGDTATLALAACWPDADDDLVGHQRAAHAVCSSVADVMTAMPGAPKLVVHVQNLHVWGERGVGAIITELCVGNHVASIHFDQVFSDASSTWSGLHYAASWRALRSLSLRVERMFSPDELQVMQFQLTEGARFALRSRLMSQLTQLTCSASEDYFGSATGIGWGGELWGLLAGAYPQRLQKMYLKSKETARCHSYSVARFTSLTHLQLHKVSGLDLGQLANMQQLRFLGVDIGIIVGHADAALKRAALAELTNLQCISLAGISDAPEQWTQVLCGLPSASLLELNIRSALVYKGSWISQQRWAAFEAEVAAHIATMRKLHTLCIGEILIRPDDTFSGMQLQNALAQLLLACMP